VRPVALSFFRGVLWSGAGVAGCNSLSFASPKESKQRKGDPTCCVPSLRCGQPAVLGPDGVSLNSLRSNNAIPDPSGPPLLGASRRGGGKEYRIPEETRTRHGESLLVFVLVSLSSVPFPIAPCGCAEERRLRRIRDRDCLSKASSSETPPEPSTAGCPGAKRRGRSNQDRLFFGDFLLAKQKKVTCCRQPRPAALSSERTAEAGKASTSSARTGKRTFSPNGFRRARP
jgi:hypothetical protein